VSPTTFAAALLVAAVLRPATVIRRPIAPTTTERPVADAPTRRHIGTRTAFAIGIVVATVALSPFVTAAALAIAVLARIGRPVRAARRERRDVERSLPEAMDLLVLGVRAGLTPAQAVAELSRIGPGCTRHAFGLVTHRTDRGMSFPDALGAIAETLGPIAAGLTDVIATADRYGLPLGPMLDQLANEAREARRRLDQAEARKLPVRLSFPLVTCTLPAFVLVAIAPAVIAALSSLGAPAR
jgi:tight adherence protein C